MRISIVSPFYNEAKNIPLYFNAIKKLNYPKENTEIVVVNDGSTDNSLHLIENERKECPFEIVIVNLSENKGISTAVDLGVKKAKFNHILILGLKTEIFPDALEELKKLNYPAVNGITLQKNANIFDEFFLNVKNKVHKNQLSAKNPEIFITKENFDNTPKGHTIFFCEKNLFLDSEIENKTSKHSSDDTKQLWNIVQKQNILLSPKVKCYYNTRNTFTQNLKHLYNRGPKFIDYYYHPKHNYFWLINLAILANILIIISLATQYKALEIGISLITADIIISIFLSKKIQDFFINLALFPLFTGVFYIGLVRGLFIKLKENIKK